MQKVVGSSPIIRFVEKPAGKRRVFVRLGHRFAPGTDVRSAARAEAVGLAGAIRPCNG